MASASAPHGRMPLPTANPPLFEFSNDRFALPRGAIRTTSLSRDEVLERLAVEVRELGEVDRIDAPLSKLALGDERQGSAERGRDLGLSHPCFLTSLAHPTNEVLVVGIVNRAPA